MKLGNKRGSRWTRGKRLEGTWSTSESGTLTEELLRKEIKGSVLKQSSRRRLCIEEGQKEAVNSKGSNPWRISWYVWTEQTRFHYLLCTRIRMNHFFSSDWISIPQSWTQLVLIGLEMIELDQNTEKRTHQDWYVSMWTLASVTRSLCIWWLDLLLQRI